MERIGLSSVVIEELRNEEDFVRAMTMKLGERKSLLAIEGPNEDVRKEVLQMLR